jgi:nucleoside-diphosphate kinase
MELERTLIVMKPDAVQRGIVGEILQRFERVGLKIVGSKMVSPTYEHLFTHYETIGKMITRRGQEVFDDYMKYITSGPVIAFVLEGVEAVAVVRKIVGATEPKAADMGTVRGDYAHVSFGYASSKHKATPNLIHASGDAKEATEEIAHWFRPEELVSYDTVLEAFER